MSLPRAVIAVSPPTHPIYSRWQAAPVADACGERLPNYHTPLGHPQQADPPHTLSPCCSHARRQSGPKLARSPPSRPRRPRSLPPACRVRPTARPPRPIPSLRFLKLSDLLLHPPTTPPSPAQHSLLPLKVSHRRPSAQAGRAACSRPGASTARPRVTRVGCRPPRARVHQGGTQLGRSLRYRSS